MAYVVASGPPGQDATHLWTPATGTSPPTLNARITDPPTYPWIKVTDIDGWRDMPETEDRRASRSTGLGEIPYESDMLGKTLVYECEARAQTREDIAALVTGALQGFANSYDVEGTMTVTPYASIGGPVWTFKARCLIVDPENGWNYIESRPWRFSWPFTVSLRMSDPKFYTGGVGYY